MQKNDLSEWTDNLSNAQTFIYFKATWTIGLLPAMFPQTFTNQLLICVKIINLHHN